MTGARQAVFWTLMGLMAASALSLALGISTMGLYLRKERVEALRLLTEMHPESESWVRIGDDRLESPEVVTTLGTDNYVTRRMALRNADRPTFLEFHAAYYTGMIDTVPHVPERCFVGGGLQLGSSSRTMDVHLDLSPSSMLRDEDDDPFVPERTPERFRPVVREDGSRGVYWIRISSAHSSARGQYVRVPFDPRDVRVRVTEFLGPDDRPFYSAYFFIANGSVTPNARDVRQLAFKLTDRRAYYLKVQFTSMSVESSEELVSLVRSYLDENLGEILLCVPDWISLRMRDEDSALDG